MHISVALCSYNGAAYIQEQLKSIAAQSRLPDELIISDDGSEDASLSVILLFSSTAPFPVRVIENPLRLGSTANFSKTIGLCTGDLVVLADQDDIWLPDKLRHIEQYFIEKPDTDVLFSNAELLDAQGRRLPGSIWDRTGFGYRQQQAIQKKQGMDCLYRGNFVTGATLAFRANLKKCFLPIPEIWVHDYWIAVIASVISKLDFIDKNLVQYRCHSEQQLGVNGGFSSKWHKFRKFDSHIYFSAQKMWTEVAQRLYELDANRYALDIHDAQEMAGHMTRRGNLPSHRLKRLPIILNETMSGKYHRYSSGFFSILHDLIAYQA